MQHDITPQQAREQLAEAEASTDRRAGDRKVHALATAGFGLLIGGYLALSRLADGASWQTPLIACYVLLLLGLAAWQTRSARTWPRHARRASWVGLGATVVLFFVAVVGLNVLEAQAEADGGAWPGSIALLLLCGFVVALPMLVAALVIRRGPQP